MVLELVHVKLQGTFVPPEATKENGADLVHVLGRETAEDPVRAVRSRRPEEVEELLVRLVRATRCSDRLSVASYIHERVEEMGQTLLVR